MGRGAVVCDGRAQGFQVLMWLHCLNLVRKQVDQKRLSVRMTYLIGNIVDLVVKLVVTARAALLHRVQREALSTYLLQKEIHTTVTSMYEHFMDQH